MFDTDKNRTDTSLELLLGVYVILPNICADERNTSEKCEGVCIASSSCMCRPQQLTGSAIVYSMAYLIGSINKLF